MPPTAPISATMVCLGTFAKHTVVNQASCVKILDHYPLDKACLIGCGVTTGWGSSVYAAEVRPGDDVVVIGIGGIGRLGHPGCRAWPAPSGSSPSTRCPSSWRCAEKFGATHAAACIDEATRAGQRGDLGQERRQGHLHHGCGRRASHRDHHAADGQARTGGRDQHPPHGETDVTLSLTWLTLIEKQVVGTIFGSANIRYDIPHLLRLYDQGQLDLDSMVTRTYKLEDVNQGYADMLDGRNIRGVLQYE